MKVNVLGTKYKIVKNVKEKDDPRIKGCDGYCDFTTKTICIAEMIQDDETFENLDLWEHKVIRHELVHAFLYESGLDVCNEFARNETLVDWMSIQIPKMAKLFDKLEV